MAYQLGGGSAPASSPAAPTTYPTLTPGDLAAARGTGTAPAAAPPSLASIAAGMAHGTVADQIAQITQLKAADIAAAAAQAKQIGQASQAAAQFLGPGGYNLGGLAAQDYANAIAQTGGLASGYTGQLRDDLAGQAAAATNTLRGIPGNEQTVTDNGGSLANTLYGLRGSLPGQALAAEGLAATTTARLLPAQFLATGANEALGVRASGLNAAQALNPQIATARGKLGALTQQYLGDLVSQHQKNVALQQGQERIDQAAATQQANTVYRNAYLDHLQAGDTEKVAHDRAMEAAGLSYHDALIGLATGRLGVSQFNADTSRINARTSRINANKPPASQAGPSGTPHFDSTNSNTNKYRSDQYGNPLGGKITPLPGYKVAKGGQGVVPVGSSSSGGVKLLTGTALADEIQAINGGIITMKTGIDPRTGKPPADLLTGLPLKPITNRADAIAEARAAGYFASPQLTRLTMKAINRVWPPPVKGRGSSVNLFGAAGQQTAKAATTR